MLPPNQDIDDRRPLWNSLQVFWMDTDPEIFLRDCARVCARSKYSRPEIEAIFWNEVFPAVKFNLRAGVAPEWAGFEIGWLSQRILEVNRFGHPLPARFLNSDEADWRKKLSAGIEAARQEPGSVNGLCEPESGVRCWVPFSSSGWFS